MDYIFEKFAKYIYILIYIVVYLKWFYSYNQGNLMPEINKFILK